MRSPAKTTGEGLAAAGPAVGGGRGERRVGRVAIFDSGPAARETVRMLVAVAGCQTEVAADSPSALALIERWTPDLIIIGLDDAAPDGQDFLHAYRGRSRPRVPIIVLATRPIDQEEPHELGIDGWLVKPFAAVELLELVNRFAPCS